VHLLNATEIIAVEEDTRARGKYFYEIAVAGRNGVLEGWIQIEQLPHLSAHASAEVTNATTKRVAL